MVLRLATAGAWSPADLTAPAGGSLCVLLGYGVPRRRGRICVAGQGEDAVVRYARVDATGQPSRERVMAARVSRPTARSLLATFDPAEAGLEPGQRYAWRAESSWAGCAAPGACVDRVPQHNEVTASVADPPAPDQLAVPPTRVDARDMADPAVDLAAVTFGQRGADMVLQLIATRAWRTPAPGRPAPCIRIFGGALDAPRGRICVSAGGATPGLTYARRDGSAGRPLAATVLRPSRRSLRATFSPRAVGLGAGWLSWQAESTADSGAVDRVPDAGDVLTRIAPPPPRCFGAAARAPRHRCENPHLRLAVVPSPIDAAIEPNAPCRPLERVGLVAPCGFGIDPAVRSLALIGDSHAEHWRAAVEAVAEGEGRHGVSITRTSCPLTTARTELPEPGRTDCARWNRAVPRWLAKHPAVSTVFVSENTDALIAPADQVGGYMGAWKALPTLREAHHRDPRSPAPRARRHRLHRARDRPPPARRARLRGAARPRSGRRSGGRRGGAPALATGAGRRPHALDVQRAALLPGRRRRARAQGRTSPDGGLRPDDGAVSPERGATAVGRRGVRAALALALDRERLTEVLAAALPRLGLLHVAHGQRRELCGRSQAHAGVLPLSPAPRARRALPQPRARLQLQGDPQRDPHRDQRAGDLPARPAARSSTPTSRTPEPSRTVSAVPARARRRAGAGRRASITPQRAAKRARARREPWTSMSEDGSRAAPSARAARSAISSWPRAVGWTASGSSHGAPARSSSSASAAPWSTATARTMALAARGLGAARGRPRSAGSVHSSSRSLHAASAAALARSASLVGAGVPVQRARVVDADVEAGDVVGAVQARDLLGQHVARERAVARELGERQRERLGQPLRPRLHRHAERRLAVAVGDRVAEGDEPAAGHASAARARPSTRSCSHGTACSCSGFMRTLRSTRAPSASASSAGMARGQRVAPEVQRAQEDRVVGVVHARLQDGAAGGVERRQRADARQVGDDVELGLDVQRQHVGGAQPRRPVERRAPPGREDRAEALVALQRQRLQRQPQPGGRGAGARALQADLARGAGRPR